MVMKKLKIIKKNFNSNKFRFKYYKKRKCKIFIFKKQNIKKSKRK